MNTENSVLLVQRAANRLNGAMIYVAFFCSGIAALVFEALWFRQLGWVVGNSVTAAALVITAFMLGLALGNALSLVWSRAAVLPLRRYAQLEFLVALSGVLLVYLIPLLPEFFAQLPAGLAELCRFSLPFVLMLIPTVAMGMSLPLLTTGLSQSSQDYGFRLGSLYAANTAGAVLGPLLAEFVLVPKLGINGSAWVAASLALLAAGLAWRAASRTSLAAVRPESTQQDLSAKQQRRWQPGSWPLLFIAAAAGAVLLALEVYWFRLLLQFNRATAAAFAVMLAVVLAGIALGGLWASLRLKAANLQAATRTGNSTASMGMAYAAVAAVCTVLGLYSLWLSTGWSGYRLAHWSELSLLLVQALLLMLPTALASGALFTVLANQLRECAWPALQATGLITVANTLGAACGALVTGLWLLPSWGVFTGIAACVAVYLLLSICLFFRTRQQFSRPLLFAGLPALALLALLLFPWPLDQQLLMRASASWRALDHAELVAQREGRSETLQLLAQDFLGEPLHYRLLTNGYSMSGSAEDSRRYMQAFAWLPAALQSRVDDALLISYGVGNTAEALLALDELQRLDVVDISADILSLSAVIHAEENPLDDPRVNEQLEDGRHWLLTTEQQYDLITGEPPPPRLAGIVNLYTQEYFELLYQRLKPGGYASYWLPVDQLSQASTAAVIQAFCAAFADCSLWSGANYNWVLLGSREAPPVTAADFQRLWQSPAQPLLAATGYERPELLGVSFLADTEQLQAWLATLTAKKPVLALQDNFPGRLADEAADENAMQHYAALLEPQAAERRFTVSQWVQNYWPEPLRVATREQWLWQPVLNQQIGSAMATRLQIAEQLLRYSQLRVPVLTLLHSGLRQQQVLRQVNWKSLDENQQEVFLYHAVVGALAAREAASAWQLVEQLHGLDPQRYKGLAGLVACQAGLLAQANAFAWPCVLK